MSFNTVTISLEEYNDLIKRNKELEKIIKSDAKNIVAFNPCEYSGWEDIKGNIVFNIEFPLKERIKELEQELSNHKIKKKHSGDFGNDSIQTNAFSR